MPSRLWGWSMASAPFLATVWLASCGSGGDPRNFGLTVTPSTVTVVADYTTPAMTLTIHRYNGFTDDVQFVAEPAPGLECVPASCTKSTATAVGFRFNTNANLAPGKYPVVFHGTGGSYPHDITANVQVLPYDGTTPPPDFDFDVDPQYSLFTTRSGISLKGTVFYQFSFYRYNHYTGPITVSGVVDPELTCGASCTVTTTADTAMLAVSVTGAEPSIYQNVFTATGGGVTRTASATIVVTQPPPSPPLPGGL